MDSMDKGLTWLVSADWLGDCTKMGADSSAKNTQKSFGPICLPKLKSLGFSKKKAPSPGCP